jgi:hypothetical protein
LTLPNSQATTFENKAFHGRIIFGMTYETLLSQSRGRRWFKAMVSGEQPIVELEFRDELSMFLVVLNTTVSMTFGEGADQHAEFAVLREFWLWWMENNTTPDLAKLWEFRLRMGTSSIDAWVEGYNRAQADSLGALAAPVELRPDHLVPAGTNSKN